MRGRESGFLADVAWVADARAGEAALIALHCIRLLLDCS